MSLKTRRNITRQEATEALGVWETLILSGSRHERDLMQDRPAIEKRRILGIVRREYLASTSSPRDDKSDVTYIARCDPHTQRSIGALRRIADGLETT